MQIAIDLLPQEFRIEELKRAKLYKLQTIGIILIFVVSFIAVAVVTLRILQSQNLIQTQAKLAQAEERVSELKTTQGSLLLLKNRLTTVSKVLEVPSVGVSLFQLINQLLPSSVSIGSFSIGKKGEILILATSQDAQSLEQLFDGLNSKETNQGKISEITLENISRGRDGLYRMNFTVKPK